MNEKYKKYSKYTVIPEQLWETDSLSWIEKCLAALIDQLDDGKEGCYASNSWLAKKMGIPERTIERHLSSLKKNGWIVVLNKDKRNRKLGGFSRVFDNGVFNPANLRNYIPQEEKTSSIIYSKQKEYIPPIISPTGGESVGGFEDEEGIIETPSTETSPKESFEAFWSIYPRKIGKENAYKQFEANLRKKRNFKEMLNSAKLYSAYCKQRQLDPNYVKTPVAFLKNIWNDEGSLKEWELSLSKPEESKIPFSRMPTDAAHRLRKLIATKQLLDAHGNPITERTGFVEEFLNSGFWGSLPGFVQKAIVEFQPAVEMKSAAEVPEPTGWREHLKQNYDPENETLQRYLLKGWKSIPEWLQRDIVFEMGSSAKG